MTLIADLTPDRWTRVAKRVHISRWEDRWAWDLPPREVPVLQIARLHGSIFTVQQRDETGAWVLLAKLVRKGRPAQGPEAFALAGRGMFRE